MATQKFEDLGALDWDDSALIKAYNEGMSLRAKEFKEEKYKPKKGKWHVGNYCRAVYPGDNLEYEVKIIAISGDSCTVEFLGYNEDQVVALDTLMESKGKKARKKQVKKAKERFSMDGSVSGDERQQRHDFSEIQIPPHPAPGPSLQTQVPVPVMPPYNPMMMQSTPIPPCDMLQNPSLSGMLTSWYLAGYYTGLHQGQSQKNNCQQRCCCQPVQNCCHH